MPVTALKFKDICNKLDDKYLGLLAHFENIYNKQCKDSYRLKLLLKEKNWFILEFERLQKLAIQNIDKEENDAIYTKAMSIMNGAVESLIQEVLEHLKPSNKIKNNYPIPINNHYYVDDKYKDLVIQQLTKENSQLKDLLTKSTKENLQLKRWLDGYSKMNDIVNKDIMGDDHNNDCYQQSKYCNGFHPQKNGYSYNVGPPLPNPSLNINLTASKLKLGSLQK
ncbi:MAG: hypothetical protein HRU35_03625 [Rickettsiaceae bacterium]|nr:hypothetical protein [Rickettsiaceae bacterium]